jgi:hypothetical protein
VTDDHLAPQAIAYANFRARVSRVLALGFLTLSVLEAVGALYSSFGRIFYAFVCAVFLAIGILWFWQGRLCQKAAQTMIHARTG